MMARTSPASMRRARAENSRQLLIERPDEFVHIDVRVGGWRCHRGNRAIVCRFFATAKANKNNRSQRKNKRNLKGFSHKHGKMF